MNLKHDNKICKQCKEEFTLKRRNQVFCTNLCYKKSYLVTCKMRKREWRKMWDTYHETKDKNLYATLIAFMYNEKCYNNKSK